MAPQTRARSAATTAKQTSADPTAAKATSTKATSAEPKKIQQYSRRAKSPLIGPKVISDEDWANQRKVFHSQVDAYERIMFKHMNSGILPFNFLREMAHEPWLSERRQPKPRQPVPKKPAPEADPKPEAVCPPQPDPEPEGPSPPQPNPDPEAPSHPQPNPESEAPSPQPNPDPEAPSPPPNPKPEAPSPPPNPEPEAASTTNTRRRMKRRQASKDNNATAPPPPSDCNEEAAALNAPSDQPSVPKKKRLHRQQRNDAGPDLISELEDESDDEQHESDDEQQPSVDVDDDGARRCRLQHTFRSLQNLGEALKATGAELDAETVQSLVETRRIRRKNKDEPRRGWGLGKPRDPAPHQKDLH